MRWKKVLLSSIGFCKETQLVFRNEGALSNIFAESRHRNVSVAPGFGTGEFERANGDIRLPEVRFDPGHQIFESARHIGAWWCRNSWSSPFALEGQSASKSILARNVA